MNIGDLFAQLTLRLAMGIALAMFLVSGKQVPAAFFRVHLWVLMGLNTFAALLLTSNPSAHSSAFGLVVIAAIVAYFASVVWLYESANLGKIGLILVAVLDGWAAMWLPKSGDVLEIVSSGILFGTAMTAMLLGHWYLNTPTMQLRPLRNLLGFLLVAVLIRGICELTVGHTDDAVLLQIPPAWVSLRWLAGIAGTLVLVGMTWQTLKIPNTQSATGLLYVLVVMVFIGESISVFLTI